MNLSPANFAFWSILGAWALVVSAVTFAVSKLLTRPRHRAILLLSAMICTLLPFFAKELPATKDFGIVSSGPYSTTYLPLPIRIPAEPSLDSDVSSPGIPQSSFPWPVVIVDVWLAGSALAALWLVVAVLRMNRLAKSGEVDAPMVAGFPVSRILLPSNWPGDLSPKEAEAAIAHEQVHLRRFHVQGRVFFELFRCLFWWVPSVHFAAREYERALEELADAEAIRTVKPEALANALVKVAAIGYQPKLATGATSNGKHLQVRLQKIMEKRTPGHWPAAILLMLASFGVAFAAAPRAESLAFQQQEASVKPMFGLAKGASFTYAIDYGKEHSQVEHTISEVTSDGDLTVYELSSKAKRGSYYSYLAIGESSFFSLAKRGMVGPGYEKSLRTPRLVRPYVQGSSWKWFTAWRGQTASGPDGKVPDTTKWDRTCVATIEAEENVTVKAGTFRCFRVKVDETSKAEGTVTHTEWISLEVGMVKQYQAARGQSPEVSSELVKYVQGKG